MKTKIISVEEDGEDVFTKTNYCTNYKCNKAKLKNQKGFRICPVCGSSYGKVRK
jgi:hypothetical protein